MKKIILFLSILACCSTIFAAPFNKIVFFGDSLTDDGNLYRILFKIIPKSPPYYKGRFTNGMTWAEHIGKHYYTKNYIDYKIYALGGATAILHKFTGRFFSPTLLEIEVDKYLLDSLFTDKSNVLYSIWIGGNDYLYDETTDIEVGTSAVIDKIESIVTKLISYGAQYFLLFNLPDLSKVPMGRESGAASKLQTLSIVNNQKLAQAIQNIQSQHPDIKIIFIDIFNTMNELIAHPEIYNQKYNTNIQNTIDPCWLGGFFFKNVASDDILRQDIQHAFAKKMTPLNDVDSRSISDFIFSSPVLYHAYKMGKEYEMGMVPCGNAEQYLFWDHIHPTETIHKVLSRIIMESIDRELA